MVKIRPIISSDLKRLAEIYAAVYRDFKTGEEWSEEAAYKLLDYYFKKQPDLAFLAENDSELIGGFLSAIKPWYDGNHLFDGEIFVATDFQKKGVGSLLVKEMFKIALEKYQVVAWDAYTFSSFDHPLKWYKSLGFEVCPGLVMFSGDVSKALNKISHRLPG